MGFMHFSLCIIAISTVLFKLSIPVPWQWLKWQGSSEGRNGGSSTPGSNQCAVAMGTCKLIREPQRVHYSETHLSASPKWNYRKWRTLSFLFLHHSLLPTVQRQRSKSLSAFPKKPSYARQGSKPPGKFMRSISVSLRRRTSASRVTLSLKIMGIYWQAKSVPPRCSQDACSLARTRLRTSFRVGHKLLDSNYARG